MEIINVPFNIVDWNWIQTTKDEGEKGFAISKTHSVGNLRVRMVKYSPGYIADHWCSRGHILLVLDGELQTVLNDGQTFNLKPGMSFQVSDGEESHKVSTVTGATVFLVD